MHTDHGHAISRPLVVLRRQGRQREQQTQGTAELTCPHLTYHILVVRTTRLRYLPTDNSTFLFNLTQTSLLSTSPLAYWRSCTLTPTHLPLPQLGVL